MMNSRTKVKKAEKLLDIVHADVDANPSYYEGHKLYNIHNDLTGFLVNYSLYDTDLKSQATGIKIYDINPQGRKYHEKDFDRHNFDRLIDKCKLHLKDPVVLNPIPPAKVMDIESGTIYEERHNLKVVDQLIRGLEFRQRQRRYAR